MQPASELIHITEGHLDDLEALALKQCVQRRLLGLAHHFSGANDQDVHTQPLAALRSPRPTRVVWHGRLDKTPPVVPEQPEVLFHAGTLGVRQHKPWAEWHKRAVKVRG